MVIEPGPCDYRCRIFNESSREQRTKFAHFESKTFGQYCMFETLFCTAVKVFHVNDHRSYVHNLSSCEN